MFLLSYLPFFDANLNPELYYITNVMGFFEMLIFCTQRSALDYLLVFL